MWSGSVQRTPLSVAVWSVAPKVSLPVAGECNIVAITNKTCESGKGRGRTTPFKVSALLLSPSKIVLQAHCVNGLKAKPAKGELLCR
eukprot:1353828-Amphidinium_carterae.1